MNDKLGFDDDIDIAIRLDELGSCQASSKDKEMGHINYSFCSVLGV
jgi:hypothetical protein